MKQKARMQGEEKEEREGKERACETYGMDTGIYEVICYFCCIVFLLHASSSREEVSEICQICGGLGLYIHAIECGR